MKRAHNAHKEVHVKRLLFFIFTSSALQFVSFPINIIQALAADDRTHVEGIVATINNEIISKSDLAGLKNKFEKGVVVDDLLLFGKTPASILADKKLLLDYLMSERVLESEIKRLNLSVTIERVEQELRDIARKNNMSRADLNGAIKAQGSSVSEYQDFIKNRIERQNLIIQEISSKIRVTDEDVLSSYLKKNPGQNTGVFEYNLSHIQFNFKKGGQSGALERAQKVHAKLVGGESFEALAEQYTEDANFSPGGSLGVFKSGEFLKSFENAVSKLESGQVSDVVQAKNSYHILKVIGKKITSDPNYEKQKEKIRNELFEEIFQRHFKSWLEQKKEESFIRINSQ